MSLPKAEKIDVVWDTVFAAVNDDFLTQLHAVVKSPAPGDCNRFFRAYGARPLSQTLGEKIFEEFIAYRILPDRLLGQSEWDENVRFLLERVQLILRSLTLGETILPEVMPAARAWLTAPLPDDLSGIAAWVANSDRFALSRTFRYLGGKFIVSACDAAKDIERFYGFCSARNMFRDQLRLFMERKSNAPLLITSLPGYGKTSLTVSYALGNPAITLILPDPGALENDLELLMKQLGARSDRNFVVFFDDIDPDKIDWYYFRMHVGGVFQIPDNVLPVLASNYEFPANIISRGRLIKFPVFDEIRCMEMVEDFLADFGLKHINRNLISLIAADYTEEFGQKKFTELSPRSLTRYLNIYHTDRIKRKTIVEIAMGPMITRPDPQLFYEFNIELMRNLYGQEYIDRILKEKLESL